LSKGVGAVTKKGDVLAGLDQVLHPPQDWEGVDDGVVVVARPPVEEVDGLLDDPNSGGVWEDELLGIQGTSTHGVVRLLIKNL